jgi:hypothetical protein
MLDTRRRGGQKKKSTHIADEIIAMIPAIYPRSASAERGGRSFTSLLCNIRHFPAITLSVIRLSAFDPQPKDLLSNELIFLAGRQDFIPVKMGS